MGRAQLIGDWAREQQILTQFDGKTNLWKSSSLEAVFEELNFSLTQGKWQRLAELSLALRFAANSHPPLPKHIDGNHFVSFFSFHFPYIFFSLQRHRDCFAREIPASEAITIEGQDLRANKCASLFFEIIILFYLNQKRK